MKMKRFLGILLSLVMVLGLMPGMSLTAMAIPPEQKHGNVYEYDKVGIGQWNGDPYAALLNTTTVVNFDGKQWYLIENNSTAVDAGTVTLLSKECVAASMYDSNGQSHTYSGSTVETAVNNYYTNSISSNVKTAIVDNKMFLLTKDQAKAITNAEVGKCSQFSGTDANLWWLCSPGSSDTFVDCVDGGNGSVVDDGALVYQTRGVRPALKLNLESVIFSSESKTFSLKPAGYSVTLSGGANATTSGGATCQTGLTGAMTTVTYTANTGYCFAEFADISSNGITARRTSSTVVTVSGTPTADATITVPDAVEKTAATVTKAPTAKSLTYTGSAQELVTAGEATGGTMQYAIGKDDKTAPTDGWSASIPSKTNAGTYYVWYKVVGDANHNDTEPKYVTVSIAQKETEKQDTTPSGGDGGSSPQTEASAPTPSETAQQPTTTGAPTITQDAFTGVSEVIETSTDGTASVTSVSGTVGNTLRITGTVNQGGTNYPVSSFATKSFSNVDVKSIIIDLKASGNPQTVTFMPRTFKGSEAKKLTLRLSSSGQVKFSSGAMSGSKIKKVVVSGLKKKEFKRVEKKLRKSGYKGKMVKK